MAFPLTNRPAVGHRCSFDGIDRTYGTDGTNGTDGTRVFLHARDAVLMERMGRVERMGRGVFLHARAR